MSQVEGERRHEPQLHRRRGLSPLRLVRKNPLPPVLDEIENFFRSRLSGASSNRRDRRDRTDQPNFKLKYISAVLPVDEKWAIRMPGHPMYFDPDRLVFAHFFQVEFMPGGPHVEEWGDIAKELRQSTLSKHDLLDAAVEFTSLGGYGTISAFYPPEISKSTLMAGFAGDRPGSSNSENEERGHGKEVVPVSRIPVKERDHRRVLVPMPRLKFEDDEYPDSIHPGTDYSDTESFNTRGRRRHH
ncbi:hypothetical protein F5Y09DRAFT_305687 [Xylaria sp. FL1042]|nr:hypothetical protein F5Y09DRAFT_305687 [Xylaria sp. FL1042]